MVHSLGNMANDGVAVGWGGVGCAALARQSIVTRPARTEAGGAADPGSGPGSRCPRLRGLARASRGRRGRSQSTRCRQPDSVSVASLRIRSRERTCERGWADLLYLWRVRSFPAAEWCARVRAGGAAPRKRRTSPLKRVAR
jgi:hypothetical protein